MKNRFAFVVFLLFFFNNCFADKLSESQINQYKRSIVKVFNGSRLGTGFVYQDKQYVVTAFHVIAGNNNVYVQYTAFGNTQYPATVIKTYKRADLALLRINAPIDVPVLQQSLTVPAYNDEYTAIGFLWTAPDYLPRDIKKKQTKQLRDFLPDFSKQDVVNNGSPSIDLNIFCLGGESLVPGYSGAPIFNNDGKIIGIGDGGVRDGAAGASWAIPASNINLLFASTGVEPGNSQANHTTFSADIIDNPNYLNEYLTIGGRKFSRIKTEKLSQLWNTTDDITGLTQILNTFPPAIDKPNLLFDVYQNFASGAVIILPNGLQITQTDGMVKVYSSDRRSVLTIDVRTLPISEVNSVSTSMENSISNVYPNIDGYTWMPDPNFTYIMPMNRMDGLVARRKAFTQLKAHLDALGQPAPMFSNYVLESFIFRNDCLLQLYVANLNYNNQYFINRMPCDQSNYTAAGCNNILRQVKDWASLVVATHFATFTN